MLQGMNRGENIRLHNFLAAILMKMPFTINNKPLCATAKARAARGRVWGTYFVNLYPMPRIE